MQDRLKCILVFFQVMLVLNWINTCVMCWGAINQTIRTRYIAYVETFMFDNISGSIFLILFYKVLYTFKQVEVQINPKYDSADMILQTLKKYRLTERVLLSINAVMTILVVVLMVPSFQSKEQKMFCLIDVIIV